MDYVHGKQTVFFSCHQPVGVNGVSCEYGIGLEIRQQRAHIRDINLTRSLTDEVNVDLGARQGREYISCIHVASDQTGYYYRKVGVEYPPAISTMFRILWPTTEMIDMFCLTVTEPITLSSDARCLVTKASFSFLSIETARLSIVYHC